MASENSSNEGIISTSQPDGGYIEIEACQPEIEKLQAIVQDNEEGVLDSDTNVAESDKTVKREVDVNIHDVAESGKTLKEEIDVDVNATEESDETFDNACQPCLSEDKNVESKKYCVNCEEYLCETCVDQHKKFKISRNHHFLNKADIQEINEPKLVVKPLESCSQHFGKELNLFCRTHDKICCASCKAIDHRECSNVIMLTEAAAGVRDHEEFKDVNSELKLSQSRLNNIVVERENDGVRILTERDAAVEVLEKTAADMVKLVDKLKKADEVRINSKQENHSKIIQKDVTNCKEVVSMLGNVSEVLENEAVNDTYLFTQMKRAQQNIKSADRVATLVSKNIGVEKIVYKEDKSIFAMLDEFKGLGNVKRVYQKSLPKTCLNILEEYEITATINSIHKLGSGRLLIADWKNTNIKLYNTLTNEVTGSLNFEFSPFEICAITDGEFAVTLMLGKVVYFVSVDSSNQSLVKSSVKSIDTGEKCRGIAYLDPELFVACGGGSNEGPGHIQVFMLDGQLKRKIVVDSSSAIASIFPWKLAVSPVTKVLYILDLDLGLLKVDSRDDIVSHFVKKKRTKSEGGLKKRNTSKGGLAFDEAGDIFKADFWDNTIDHIGNDGQLKANVLTEEDGIKKPLTVTYDHKTRQLFVGLEDSPELHVYHFDCYRKYDK